MKSDCHGVEFYYSTRKLTVREKRAMGMRLLSGNEHVVEPFCSRCHEPCKPKKEGKDG